MKILQRKFKYQTGDWVNDSQLPINCKIHDLATLLFKEIPSRWELRIEIRSRDSVISCIFELPDLPIQKGSDVDSYAVAHLELFLPHCLGRIPVALQQTVHEGIYK